jgi:hypothetical protein
VVTKRLKQDIERQLRKPGGLEELNRAIAEAAKALPPKLGRPPVDCFECLAVDTDSDGCRIVTFRLNGKMQLAIVRPRYGKTRPGLYRTIFETLCEVAGDEDIARRWMSSLRKEK